MLHVMLGNAPNAFSCGEVYAWFRPWRTHHFDIDCSCGQVPCPCWERIKQGPENLFHKQVFERLSVNYVVDCSKDPTWIIDNNYWAARNKIKVANLLLWKDPIDFAYSLWKRNQLYPLSEDFFLSYYRRFFRLGLPFVSVSYTELVKNPATKLKQICRAVGMEYFPEKEHFWEKQHHFLFGSGGVREQVRRGESEIRFKPFPPEFAEEEESLKKTFENNRKVTEVLAVLQRFEVSVKQDEVSKVHSEEDLPKRPLWYYKHRLKRVFRRYFPRRHVEETKS